MPDHSGPWPAGTPCWVDLMASDIDRTRAFYREVLGWDFTEPVAEFGGYRSALVRGGQVAGLSPTMPGMEDAPHVWSVYLATDDIGATAAAAAGAGASPAGGIGSASELSVPGWAVCFQDGDVDAVASRIAGAAGAVVRAPFEFGFGRLVLADGPDGERFAVMSPAPTGG